jgi:hypothetical protein
MPKCPEALQPKLREKINKYVDAGWWELKPVPQAVPLLCFPKKPDGLRTVVDARQRNDNTVKDVTPFPDQDAIRMDVARAPHRSKINMSDAYEQIQVIDSDVWKTVFATPFGTAVSHVMQQGDCNAPATFQRLMTWILWDVIGDFVHVYLDDIFIFSKSVEDHEAHLKLVFDRLGAQRLYLSRRKCDLYSKDMDCLGHRIDDRWLHTDEDEMTKVLDWRSPRSHNEVLRLLGLIQYLAQFLPDVAHYTSPLEGICRDGQPFVWRTFHQLCLERIKAIVRKTPILRPIDMNNPDPI